jgi:hypothetical protein
MTDSRGRGRWITANSGPDGYVPPADVETLARDAMNAHPENAEAIHNILAAYRAGDLTAATARMYLTGAEDES